MFLLWLQREKQQKCNEEHSSTSYYFLWELFSFVSSLRTIIWMEVKVIFVIENVKITYIASNISLTI